MKNVFGVGIFLTCTFFGTISASTHEAWSDWIIEFHGKNKGEPEEIAEEVEESASKDSEDTEAR